MTVRKARRADDLPDHLFRWMDSVGRQLRAELVAQRNGRELPTLRGGQSRMLQLIPSRGIRISDLAVRARMTKQATGQFVDELEARGYVRSGKDPRDGRVRLVRRTPRGDRASEAISRAISRVEQQWQARVGPRRYATMKAVLRALAE
jgi:DNA-binding MarR family transcriptional regulator